MQISIDITDRCNLNCKYCFEKKRKKNPIEFSVDEIKAIYDKFEPTMLHLFGGEPTLRWNDILECIDYVVPKMKMRIKNNENLYQCVSITTNGTTGVDFETIPKEYRKYISCYFSLDGFKEINDKYRGKDNYEKTHDSIVRCKKANIYTGISTTRTLEDYLDNLDEFEKFVYYYINNVGVNVIRASNNLSLDNGRQLDSKYMQLFTKEINRIANNLYNPNLLKIRHNLPCRQQNIHIRSNGYINPRCPLLDSPIIGHWTQWNKEDLIKLLNYCDKSCFDCQSKNDVRVKKFAEGLLKIRGEYYEV